MAELLEVKLSTLTYILYKLNPNTQYYQFYIPKKNGDKRIINAPNDGLKNLQSKLSFLLQNCLDKINEVKYPKAKGSTLAHGFIRNRSIITNAMMHLNKNNVLNIDLDNFFDSFNFGRVRGFFIKNRNFALAPDIATVIAQIACYNNKLPQGSPCSPVITNLITHSLDIRLASLAKKYSCKYSRYADDITFSTRKSIFPIQVMRQEKNGIYIPGKKLRNEISRAGFSINNKKTRIQYKDSRQDVTGLIVNKKPNIKKEYWRTVRSQCHRLFQTGSFNKKTASGEETGNINELEGQLDFIDYIDKYNRLRQKPPLNSAYALKRHGHNTIPLLSGREKNFSRFLYYRFFYGNITPTILCEGQTDIIYLKAAISKLIADYPKLATIRTNNSPCKCKLLVQFFKHSKRTRFLLQLYGGTSYLNNFISQFEKHYTFYKAPKPQHPIIILLDNDEGFADIKKNLANLKEKKLKVATVYPTRLKSDDYRKADFIHFMHNLYIILTPLDSNGNDTDIESLFDDTARLKEYKGKKFNTATKRDKDLSKDSFAKYIINAQKSSINFDGLKPLLDRIVAAITHYDSIEDPLQ